MYKDEADKLYSAYLSVLQSKVVSEIDGRTWLTNLFETPEAVRVNLVARNLDDAAELEKLLFWSTKQSTILQSVEETINRYTGKDKRTLLENADALKKTYSSPTSADWHTLPEKWDDFLTLLDPERRSSQLRISPLEYRNEKHLYGTFRVLLPETLMAAVTRVALANKPAIDSLPFTETEQSFALFFKQMAAKISKVEAEDASLEYLPKDSIETSLVELHRKLVASSFVAAHDVQIDRNGFVFVDGAEVTRMSTRKALLAIAVVTRSTGCLEFDRDAFVRLTRGSIADANKDFSTEMIRLKKELRFFRYFGAECSKRVSGLIYSRVDLSKPDLASVVERLRRHSKKSGIPSKAN